MSGNRECFYCKQSFPQNIFPEHLKQCKARRARKPSQNVPPNALQPSSNASPPWNCPMCSFSNQANCTNCTMCKRGKRPHMGNAQPVQYWQCQSCTFVNSATSMTCKICSNPKPNANASSNQPKPGIQNAPVNQSFNSFNKQPSVPAMNKYNMQPLNAQQPMQMNAQFMQYSPMQQQMYQQQLLQQKQQQNQKPQQPQQLTPLQMQQMKMGRNVHGMQQPMGGQMSGYPQKMGGQQQQMVGGQQQMVGGQQKVGGQKQKKVAYGMQQAPKQVEYGQQSPPQKNGNQYGGFPLQQQASSPPSYEDLLRNKSNKQGIQAPPSFKPPVEPAPMAGENGTSHQSSGSEVNAVSGVSAPYQMKVEQPPIIQQQHQQFRNQQVEEQKRQQMELQQKQQQMQLQQKQQQMQQKQMQVDEQKRQQMQQMEQQMQNRQPMQNQQQFGQNNQQFVQNQQKFGQNNQQFAQNQQKFGQNSQQFNQNQQFGQNKQQFNQNKQKFNQNNQQFGQNNNQFNQNKQQYNQQPQIFQQKSKPEQPPPVSNEPYVDPEAATLLLIQQMLEADLCGVCHKQQGFQIPCHNICGSCAKKYLLQGIVQQKWKKQNLTCPVVNCKSVMPEWILKQCGLGQTYQQQIEEMQKTYMVASDPSMAQCPKCHETFVCETGDMSSVNNKEKGLDGKPLTMEAVRHKAQYRFRCSNSSCKTIFCSGCQVEPYHLGYTCDAWQNYQSAKKCRFCECQLEHTNTAPVEYGLGPGLVNVCNSEECLEKRDWSCDKIQKCGHMCIGLRGHPCLPCMHLDCVKNKDATNDNDFCNICWVDPLRACPTVKLGCNHYFHFMCLWQKIDRKWPAARITFGFLNCPLCKTPIRHPALKNITDEYYELKETIQKDATERVKIEGLERDKRLLNKKSKYYNNLALFAMDRLAFYPCSKCKKPYFGGMKACEEAGLEMEEKYKTEHLVCGSCSSGPNSKACKKHGKKYITYKCKFCCSIGSWYCWGSTHFCDKCHKKQEKGDYLNRKPISDLPVCPGVETCPLGIKHPANGTAEFSLGCVVCLRK